MLVSAIEQLHARPIGVEKDPLTLKEIEWQQVVTVVAPPIRRGLKTGGGPQPGAARLGQNMAKSLGVALGLRRRAQGKAGHQQTGASRKLRAKPKAKYQ